MNDIEKIQRSINEMIERSVEKLYSILEDSSDKHEQSAKQAYSTLELLFSGNKTAQPAETTSSQPEDTPESRQLQSAEQAFAKLEAYYPEHKVFALDSIDGYLREKMAMLYKSMGFSTINEMFAAYGFEIISGDAVRALRSFVLYGPGEEPDIIRNQVDSMLRRLEEYYPDHRITKSIQAEHKNLSKSISGLYQWLGYSDAQDMLKAYGYDYIVSRAGRPQARDYDALIDALVEKYKDQPKPRSMGALLYDNPDLKGALKTLNNKSNEVFGMPLRQYFETLGIFAEREASRVQKSGSVTVGIQEEALEILRRRYINYQGQHSYEDAVKALENMNVKQNKAGQIYVFRVGECGKDVVIPYGIDFISPRAFSGITELEKITIEAGLQAIPDEAFMNCSSLREISIPDSVNAIGWSAFKNCFSLREISIPGSVITIGPGAFESCASLQRVIISEGVFSIGTGAFVKCTSLEQITLPATLREIARRTFAGCTALKDVEIRNPRIIANSDAFDGCPYEYTPVEETGFTDAKYFNYSMDRKGNITITGLRDNASDLEDISIPGSIDGHPVTIIGKEAFCGCQKLVHVDMPDYIDTIRGAAFKDCISLKTIHISNAVSKIVNTTFKGCISLREVNIPDALTEVVKSAFSDSPLERLHIGKSLCTLDANPFYKGTYDSYTGKKISTRDIKEVTIDPENPHLVTDHNVVMSRDGKTIFVALGNMDKYTVPDGVETIAGSSFEGLAFMSDVELPESLITIGGKAFAGTGIRRLTFKDGLKKIREEAFSNCQNLTAVVFGNGIEEIGNGAFAGSPILSVYLPASLRIIGEGSFNCLSDRYYGLRKEQVLKIDPDNPWLEADGDALYERTDSGKSLLSYYKHRRNEETSYLDDECELAEYTVKEGTTKIADGAFRRCMGIGAVILPEGLRSIGSSAFEDCYHLSSIEIPNSVVKIGEKAFKGTAIEELTLGDSLTEIGAEAFATGGNWQNEDVSLQDIRVAETNECFFTDQKALYRKTIDGKIELHTYYGTEEVFEVKEGTSGICAGAFAGTDIQEVHIPSSVVTIGECAFESCRHLIRLRIGFSDPDKGEQYAVIYIPEIRSDQYGYFTDAGIHNYYMDCIRITGSGDLFDFVKYDSLFEGIPEVKDRILVATDRLKSAIQLVPVYKEQYLTYLQEHSVEAVQIVIEYDDLEGLRILSDLEVFTGKNIDQVIELANKTGKVDIISYLMNYKNSEIGMGSDDLISSLTLD